MPASRKPEDVISRTEKKRRALELRAKGWTYQEIADEIGWKSHVSAFNNVKAALKETLQEPADELRILETERLDKLYKFTIERMDKDNLWAVDRALNIMKRRAELLGLDSGPDEDVAEKARQYLDLYDKAKADAKDLSEQ